MTIVWNPYNNKVITGPSLSELGVFGTYLKW